MTRARLSMSPIDRGWPEAQAPMQVYAEHVGFIHREDER